MTKENEMVEFFRKAIEESGLTITQLHQKTGLTYMGIKKIVNGNTKTMQTKTVAALTAALDIPLAEVEKFYD